MQGGEVPLSLQAVLTLAMQACAEQAGSMRGCGYFCTCTAGSLQHMAYVKIEML